MATPTICKISKAEVRRLNLRRMAGVSSPPTICAPATIAATSPAMPYACGSPQSLSR